MENKCRGCRCFHSYRGGEILSCLVGIPPDMVYKEELLECPCINCLIKVVCVDICPTLQDYVALYKFGRPVKLTTDQGKKSGK